MKNKKLKLSVVGLGKLGICTAVCPAAKGYSVLGFDINKKTVNLVNQGKAPVIEPDLQSLMNRTGKNLSATNDIRELIFKSDVTLLIVPTPSRPNGHFSDQYLKDALKKLALALKNKKQYHLFVIVSTVSPGTIEKNLIPQIEKYSRKKLNQDFGICYNPEFIALGSVIRDFLNPDMVLIGESNKKAGDLLEKIYQNVCESKPYVAKMSIVSAEIAKISLNAYITMKISFANTLGNLCERIQGAEIDKITKALGADKRVSPYYLKAGPPYGGPCFPRDNRAFAAFAKKYGYDAKLAKITDRVNQLQIKLLAEKISKIIKENKIKKVAILGLAYKTNTLVIEESPALFLIKALLKKKIKIAVYDPLAMDETRKIFGKKIDYASSLKNCLSGAQLMIITTPEKSFQKITKKDFKNKPMIIIDTWRILDKKLLGENVKYIATGYFNENN